MLFECKDNEATLWIYDAIGEMFGPEAVTAKGVRDALSGLQGNERLTIRINSPGGLCDESCAIHTLLMEHGGEKIVKVDGVAASAAIDIAMTGNKIQVAPGAMMMIHNPWAMAVGDYRDMEKAVDVSKKYREARAGFISNRTRKKMTTVYTAMDAETWYTADEAVAWKLADESGIDKAVAFAKEDSDRIMNFAKEVARIAAMAMVVDGSSDAAEKLAEQALDVGRKISVATRARQLELTKEQIAAMN